MALEPLSSWMIPPFKRAETEKYFGGWEYENAGEGDKLWKG
jgi:hypothetical protein